MSATASRNTNLSMHAVIIGCAGALAFAGMSPAHSARQVLPKVIRDAVANGVKVEKTFPAESGLTGWILNEGGTYSVAYTTSDKRTLIVGNLINERGENLTDRYAEKYFPKPDRAALFDQLAHSAYTIEGASKDPGRVVYVFADPSHSDSRALRNALQPYHRAGLQVRWVPVVRSDSAGLPKAVAMLEGGGPEVFDKDDAAGAKLRSFAQSVANSINTHPEATSKIRKNNGLMEAFDFNSLPGIVWQDRAGKVHVHSGMPQQATITRMTGLPRQTAATPAPVRPK